MKIGDNVMLTESVLVFDELGHDLLLAGTIGSITSIEGALLSLHTPKGSYDNIPIVSAKLIEQEGNAA